MDKWADFVITGVRFNSAGTHIDQVQARPDNGGTIGAATTRTRQEIISAINNGTTFVTAYSKDEKWSLGKKVYVIKINSSEFIKTVADQKLVDNLDNLPTF
jgi:hypothetical protein